MTEVEWARLPARELREIAGRPGSLAILPIGSLEQHGPHLPVITDTASASAAAVAAARLVADRVPVAVLPGLWLGMSEHHLPFGGTVSADFDTLRAMLRSIARSLVSGGFKRLMIVNGHGGNDEPLAVVARELAVELDFTIVVTMPWHLAAEEQAAILESDDSVHHACEGEAALMLAIAPDDVRTDRFGEAFGNQSHPAPVAGHISRFYSFSERAPLTGTWGDPRSATAEKGRAFLAIQARELARLIDEEAIWTRPDPVWAPGRGQKTTAGRLSD